GDVDRRPAPGTAVGGPDGGGVGTGRDGRGDAPASARAARDDGGDHVGGVTGGPRRGVGGGERAAVGHAGGIADGYRWTGVPRRALRAVALLELDVALGAAGSAGRALLGGGL